MRRKVRLIIGFSIAVALICFVFVYLEVNPLDAFISAPEFARFFMKNFLPPSFKNIDSYLPLVIETVLFSLVATYISAFFAFVFGILISEKTNPIRWLRMTVRFIMSFMRNIPVLVWAAFMVYIFGIGSLVGLISLVIATLGFLARSYGESLNEIAGSKIEALRASGASYPQILIHGIIPEFVPSWINWTLFSFEINIRASAVLGMVGAGGIGIMIQTNIRLFKYREAFSLILILLAMVLLTELATNRIRKAVR